MNSFVDKLRGSNMPSILLVGNGPSVTSGEYGEVIDQFEEVVRFNTWGDHAVGFERCIGSRMTTWVLNETMPASTRPPDGVAVVRILAEGYSNDFHADVKLTRSVPAVTNPSSGVVMANNFLTWGTKVYVVGMDGYEGSTRNYWQALDEGRRPHESEVHFWNQHRDQLIPLEGALE